MFSGNDFVKPFIGLMVMVFVAGWVTIESIFWLISYLSQHLRWVS